MSSEALATSADSCATSSARGDARGLASAPRVREEALRLLCQPARSFRSAKLAASHMVNEVSDDVVGFG